METHFKDRPERFANPPCDHEPDLDVAAPAIVLHHRAGTLLALAAMSGLASNVWLWTHDPIAVWFGPGLLFGLLVMLPWCHWCEISGWKTAATVALAPVGYAAAVYAYFHAWWFFSGLIGCTICFGSLLAGEHPRVREGAWMAGLIGWCIGAVMILPLVPFLGGVAFWQVAVAACLSTALRIEKR